jgi:hypothetical protein
VSDEHRRIAPESNGERLESAAERRAVAITDGKIGAPLGAPLGPSSTEYRVMRAAASRVTSVPSMCVAVRVYCSTATVSVPRRAISVVGATGAGAGIVVEPDEQATTRGSAASASRRRREAARRAQPRRREEGTRRTC